MDPSTNGSRPSGLPRPISRLPLPRAGVRPSPSKENLQQPSSRLNTISNPRLRNAPSKDQLSATTRQPSRAAAPTTQRDRDLSGGISSRTASHPLRNSSSNALLRKPSKPVLREQEQNRPDLGQEALKDEILEEAETVGRSLSSRSRPSLSERTMETLQNIPSSPAVRKRDSDFFNSDSPVRAWMVYGTNLWRRLEASVVDQKMFDYQK